MLRSARGFRCAVVAVISAATVAIVSSCADGESTPGGGDEAGAPGVGLGPADCASVGPPPEDGAECRLPEGTTCDFGCGARFARCSAGHWHYGDNGPGERCPAIVPEVDDLCAACWPAGVTCTYHAESCEDGGAEAGDGGTGQIATAACADGHWKLAYAPCGDAGADVQGDAPSIAR